MLPYMQGLLRAVPGAILFWSTVLLAFTAGAVAASLIDEGLTRAFPAASIFYDISRRHTFFLAGDTRLGLGWLIGFVFNLFLLRWFMKQMREN